MRTDRTRLIGRTAVLVAIAATGGTVTASALAHGSDDGAAGGTTTAADTSTATTPTTTTPTTTTTPSPSSRFVRIAGRVVARDATADRFVVRTGRRHRTTVLSTRVPALGLHVLVAGRRLADGTVQAASVRVVPDDRRGGRGNEPGDDHGGHGNQQGDDHGGRR
jgi:hypothetical protein